MSISGARRAGWRGTRGGRSGLILAGVLALAGCGSSAPSGTAATSAASGPNFKVGVVLPASGVYATLGKDIVNGMQLYLDQVGSQAGNRRITLLQEDETNNPATALAKTRKLVEQDAVDMISGYVATPDAYGVRDYLDQNKVVTLVSNAGGNLLSRARKSDVIYRTSFSSWQVSQPLGKYVADNVAKQALVTVADYGFGTESAAAFKESFEPAGGTLVGDDVKAPLTTVDYSPFLNRIQSANPPAVYGFYSGNNAVDFLKQAGQLGIFKSTRLTGAGFLVEQDVLPAIGDAAPDGAVSSLHWALTLDTPANRSFVTAYRSRYGKLPDVFAVQGYDTAHVIAAALDATKGNTTDRAAFVKAIAGVTFDSPRGPFRFDPATHNVVQTIYIRQLYRDPSYGWTNRVIATIPEVADPGH
jgi:branched-chain amino acid transport system substrate-binding protein